MKKSKIYDIGKDFGISKDYIDKILLKLTGLSKSRLFLDDEINDNLKDEIITSFERLKKGEPIEYILENAEFYSLDFFVDSRVLIPRNDTELMVDKAIETIIKLKNPSLIDVGTGSGCIGIGIMKNSQKIKNCYATDISRTVLKVTEENIKKHKLLDKIKTIKSNLLVKFLGNKEYSLSKNIVITANLPYIKIGDFVNMSKETVFYEPDLALYGGKQTGFELYEKLIKECELLKKLNHIEHIYLFIEIGFDQEDYSREYLEKKGLQFKYYKDNNQIQRCIKIIF